MSAVPGPGPLPWPQARARARAAAGPVPARTVPLEEASGAVLAVDVHAVTDLPAADTSAMDGWAVAGPPPWRVVGQVLAGTVPAALRPGTAVRIATGALLPPGAAGVLRSERGEVLDGGLLRAGGRAATGPAGQVPAGAGPTPDLTADVRRAGRECRRGEVVLPAGARLTPAALGLLAAAGHDEVAVRRARAEVLVLGDELLASGAARDGRVRDALGPLLGAWLPALGVRVSARRRVADRADDLAAALTGSPADLLVTTGSTARGPVDHLHCVLEALGARLVVDGVAVRPGHPQLLAVLADGRPVVGLPGNPLAAVSGLVTLLQPVVQALHGEPLRRAGDAAPRRVLLAEPVAAGADATRLVPVRGGRPALFAGPAMLRGLASADGLAVIPPGGLGAGEEAELLPVPGAT